MFNKTVKNSFIAKTQALVATEKRLVHDIEVQTAKLDSLSNCSDDETLSTHLAEALAQVRDLEKELDDAKLELSALKLSQETDIESAAERAVVLKDEHDAIIVEKQELEKSVARLQAQLKAFQSAKDDEVNDLKAAHANTCAKLQGVIDETVAVKQGSAEQAEAMIAQLRMTIKQRKESEKARIDEWQLTRLSTAFDFFDIDQSGELDEGEFMQIGQALHGVDHWNDDKNVAALSQIDRDGDGMVTRKEFLGFYERALDSTLDDSDEAFNEGLDRFLEAARQNYKTRIQMFVARNQKTGLRILRNVVRMRVEVKPP